MTDLPARHHSGWLRTCCDAVMCSPPSLPGASHAGRIVDRILPKGTWRCAFFVAVAVGLSVPSLLVGALVILVASTYCLLNFWRCREAHSIVSGTGWAALALFELTGSSVGTASPMGRSPSYSSSSSLWRSPSRCIGECGTVPTP